MPVLRCTGWMLSRSRRRTPISGLGRWACAGRIQLASFRVTVVPLPVTRKDDRTGLWPGTPRETRGIRNTGPGPPNALRLDTMSVVEPAGSPEPYEVIHLGG